MSRHFNHLDIHFTLEMLLRMIYDFKMLFFDKLQTLLDFRLLNDYIIKPQEMDALKMAFWQ